MIADVYVGVGSNMDHPVRRCREAGARLAEAGGVNLVASSSLYRTEPLGYQEQDWFVNGVYHLRTSLSPMDLLTLLQGIELEMGKRVLTRWGPRVIDLDLLLYGDLRVDRPGLQVPHPRMHQRRFVLKPLSEIAPGLRHPVLKVSVVDLLARLGEEQKVELLEKLKGTPM
jgi:2-amino-4-hydroxy-6-hydroxymethyldihydropteridine diphosphokinase